MVDVCVSSTTNHSARVALRAAHARRNISLASRCNDLVLLFKDKFHISIHPVCGHAGNAGMNAPTLRLLLANMGSSLSVIFLPDGSDSFSCNVCLYFFGKNVHCLNRIAECLHDVQLRSQLGKFLAPSR